MRSNWRPRHRSRQRYRRRGRKNQPPRTDVVAVDGPRPQLWFPAATFEQCASPNKAIFSSHGGLHEENLSPARALLRWGARGFFMAHRDRIALVAICVLLFAAD